MSYYKHMKLEVGKSVYPPDDHPYSRRNKNNWARASNHYDPLEAGSIDATDTVPHDHGISRALNSEYVPDRKIEGEPVHTIFVSGLYKHTTERSLYKAFSEFGSIKRLRIVRDLVTGVSKRYGFVEYAHGSSARRAYSENLKVVIDGSTLFIDFECERLLPGWKPRRLGGGFGGNRESGQLRYGGRTRNFKRPFEINQLSMQPNLKDVLPPVTAPNHKEASPVSDTTHQ